MRRLLISGALLTSAAAIAGCLEAPTLDDCYSAADCPAAMGCQAGVCGLPVAPPGDGAIDGARPDIAPPDLDLIDGAPVLDALPDAVPDALPDAIADAIADAMPDAMPDATADLGPDMAPPPRCRVAEQVTLHREPVTDYDIRAEVALLDPFTVAIAWQGPELTATRVACYRPGDPGPVRPAPYPVEHVGDERPALIVEPDRLLAAWVDRAAPRARLTVQPHRLDGCATDGEATVLTADDFGRVAFTRDARGTLLGARYQEPEAEIFYGLHLARVPAQGPIEPPPAAPVISPRTFALAADGAGAVVAWTAYHDATRADEVFAARVADGLARRMPLTAIGAPGVQVDGLVPIEGGFALAWRKPVDGGVKREISVMQVDGAAAIVRTVAVAHEPPDAAPAGDLALDPGGRVALAAASGGAVTLWVVQPYSDEIDAVQLGPGEHPAVVTLKAGVYGVVYGHRAGGEGRLEWARIICDLPGD